MSDVHEREGGNGAGLPRETRGGLRRASSLVLVVTGTLLLVGSGLWTIFGVVTLVQLQHSGYPAGDIRISIPWVLATGGAGFLIGLWLTAWGRRLS